tara:strand:- start:1191 stop:2504 length:1314 start_codon:yes stop_codon:yes gene_type:complete
LNQNLKKIDKIYKLGINVFPICRSITGEGNRKTLRIFKKFCNRLKIKEIKSGSKVFDWNIPPEWNIQDAYVLDKNNKKIIDFKKNNLHVVNYSEPINKVINKKNLLKKIFTNKFRTNAIPYVTSYYKKTWGFCISENEKKRIIKKYKSNDKFKIFIDSKFKKKGSLTYGEILIPGKSKKEIFLSSYICHPSMANNELSGPLMSLLVCDYFKKRKNNLSIRAIFVPETIGSIAYLSKNLTKMKKNFYCGFNLTCIGDERKYSYLPSKYGNALSDRVIIETFKNMKLKYKKYSFLERGSDERQYNSPGVDLPVACIMRSKFGTYPEYHTSDDNFKLVTKKGLHGSFKVVKNCLDILMKNIIPKATIKCEPQLGKRKLYNSLSNKQSKFFENQEICDFLQFADGTNDLLKISQYIKLPFKKTLSVYKILKKHKLVKKINK